MITLASGAGGDLATTLRFWLFCTMKIWQVAQRRKTLVAFLFTGNLVANRFASVIEIQNLSHNFYPEITACLWEPCTPVCFSHAMLPDILIFPCSPHFSIKLYLSDIAFLLILCIHIECWTCNILLCAVFEMWKRVCTLPSSTCFSSARR